jgi:hypothetical protein
MFDRVSAPYWLLLLVGLVAYAPARHVFLYFIQDPARTAPFHPEGELVDRSPRRLALNVAALLLLAALAIFIFTPFAADFAQSRSFWPLLFAAGSALLWYDVVRSFIGGKAASIVGGGVFLRDEKPLRFWAAMGWNILIAVLCAQAALKFWTEGTP